MQMFVSTVSTLYKADKDRFINQRRSKEWAKGSFLQFRSWFLFPKLYPNLYLFPSFAVLNPRLKLRQKINKLSLTFPEPHIFKKRRKDLLRRILNSSTFLEFQKILPCTSPKTSFVSAQCAIYHATWNRNHQQILHETGELSSVSLAFASWLATIKNALASRSTFLNSFQRRIAGWSRARKWRGRERESRRGWRGEESGGVII